MNNRPTSNRKSTTTQRKHDLSARLFQFSVLIIKTASALPRALADRQIGARLFMAEASAGAECEEAAGAECKPGFIYKLGIVLKELRETRYRPRLMFYRALAIVGYSTRTLCLR